MRVQGFRENPAPHPGPLPGERETIIHPQQIEFARLNLTYTVMSKRRLLELVRDKHVAGWDDPRMPTICGLRRRGYTPESIRLFCDRIGVAKFNSTIDVAVLENAVREDLNRRAPRRMAVLRPLKVVIDNYPDGKAEMLEAVNNPEDPAAGKRQDSVFANAVHRARRFPRGAAEEVFPAGPRRRSAAAVCLHHQVRRRDEGPGHRRDYRVALHVRSGNQKRRTRPAGRPKPDRKVKGTIHWVSAEHAVTAPVRLYDHLFSQPDPDEVPAGQTYLVNLNPNSLELLSDCQLGTESGRPPKPASIFSSNATAISSPMPSIRNPANPFSIGR